MLRACLAGLCLLLAACDGPAEKPVEDAAPAAKPPNILLILADDLGNNDLGSFGDGSATTPNIDALAARGIRFRRHYAHATCRPARVELLTGMSASRVGVPPHIRGITPELTTLPEALSAGGYTTSHVGKWHLGHQVASAHPLRQGFDRWFGFLHALQTGTGDIADAISSYRKPFLAAGEEDMTRHKGHLTDILTEAAADEIRKLSAEGSPWFLNVWYFAPHAPIQPAGRFARDYPRTPEGKYLALLAQLDAGVGRLLATLEETGVMDNTVVVFLSDNGGLNKVRNSNRPYYGKKNTFYEGGFRTPLIIAGPAVADAKDISDTVLSRDIMPTLLSLVGLDTPQTLDGVDLGPLLAGGEIDRAGQLFWGFRSYAWAQQGLLDLDEQSLAFGLELQQLADGENYFAEPVSMADAQLAERHQAIKQWERQVRRVMVQSRQGDDGSRLLSGDSYRRTPGMGAWSLQLPVMLNKEHAPLARQEGQFDLSISEGRLQLALPGHQVDIPLETGACNLLSVASYYEWPDRKPENAMGHVRIWMGDTPLYEDAFSIQAEIIRDDYPPTYIAPGVGLPAMHNSYLNGDPVSYYRQSTGEPVSCPSADQAA